ncbi:MAG: hypothetical protein WCQ00_02000 [bacterium]
MNKISSFCKSNKPFVAMAVAFVLLGSIFNKDLNRISNQMGLVLSIGTDRGTVGSLTLAYAYQPYPSLSDSGFYLENKAGTGGYNSAIAGIKGSMDSISKDIKDMFVYYYKNGCATSTTTACSDKTTSILNALYTYSTYSTEYNKLSYESTHGSTPITTDVDWAGIAGSSVIDMLKITTSTSSDAFLNQIASKTSQKTTAAITAGSFAYVPPTSIEALTSLTSLLKAKSAIFSVVAAVSTTPWVARGPAKNWVSITSSSDGTKLATVVQGGYIYTSTDSGTTWTATNATANRNWSGITSSADGTKLVATMYGGKIYTSTDSGLTWTARGVENSWSAVTSSSDGTKLIATANTGRIYKSTDSGITWVVTRANMANWYSVASSADGTKLAATTDGGQIYTSIDGGVSWTARASNRKWRGITSDSTGTKLAAVVSYSGQIYTSTDSGVSWTARDSARSWQSIASSADGTKLAAVVVGGQVYTSTNGGVSWTANDSARFWISIASDSTGTKLVGAVYGGNIYTQPAPTVTTISPLTPTTPYTYVFGVNVGGRSDFNIYSNSIIQTATTLPSNFVGPLQTGTTAPVDTVALSAALDKKYTVAPRSVAEADAKATLLKAVSASVGGEAMIYANMQAALESDERRNALIPVDNSSIKVGICSYTPIDYIFHELDTGNMTEEERAYAIAPYYTPSGCNGGVGTTDDGQLVNEVPAGAPAGYIFGGYGFYVETKVAWSMQKYHTTPIVCSGSLPNLPLPMDIGNFNTPASPLDIVQEKLQILAKNNLPDGVIGISKKPVGESGVMVIQFNNGKIVTVWNAGVDGKIGPPTYEQAIKFSEEIEANTNWLVKPKKAYHFHTHDINSIFSAFGQGGISSASSGAFPPSLADFQLNVYYRNQFANMSLPVITRVISPSGIGYEYSVPYGSDIFNRISNLSGEPNNFTSPDLFEMNHAYTIGLHCSTIENKRTKSIVQDYLSGEANSFFVDQKIGLNISRFKVR